MDSQNASGRHVISARALLKRKQFDLARRELKAALARDPSSGEAAALIADLERQAFRQRKAGRRGGRLSTAVAWCAVTALVAGYLWPDPRNEAVARGLVGSAYRSAQAGDTSGSAAGADLEDLQRRYGQVLSWRIVSDRRDLLFRGHWLFEVEAVRERALTREEAEACAGTVRNLGYVSGVSSIHLKRSRPRR